MLFWRYNLMCTTFLGADYDMADPAVVLPPEIKPLNLTLSGMRETGTDGNKTGKVCVLLEIRYFGILRLFQ